MKLYVDRNKDDWNLTENKTDEEASIRHLQTLIQSGENPYSLDEVEVCEGYYKWDYPTKKYIQMIEKIDENDLETKFIKGVGENIINGLLFPFFIIFLAVIAYIEFLINQYFLFMVMIAPIAWIIRGIVKIFIRRK